MDVHCGCGASFCWSCQEDAHRPVDCETVKKWLVKNGAESENMNWILANTKPCPACKRPIEKNLGCMHMVCSQCKFEFCGCAARQMERTRGAHGRTAYAYSEPLPVPGEGGREQGGEAKGGGETVSGRGHPPSGEAVGGSRRVADQAAEKDLAEMREAKILQLVGLQGPRCPS